MLNENLKAVRKRKGLSQEELAARLHVVRQTISKWEQGLSVPDSDMLISLSEILETPVSVLLGETMEAQEPDDIREISEKLEEINRQLAQRVRTRRKVLFGTFLLSGVLILLIAVCLFVLDSPYLSWDYSDPEIAVLGTAYHVFEFLFFRLAPFALIGVIIGAICTGRRL